MQYDHTQHAPLYLILVGVGIAMLIAGWAVPEQIVRIILVSSGGLMFLLAQWFGQLTVRDENDRLSICFGPLPLFRRRILYADIDSVERIRSTILDGWGILPDRRHVLGRRWIDPTPAELCPSRSPGSIWTAVTATQELTCLFQSNENFIAA